MVWSSLCPSGMTMLPTCSGSIPLIQLIRPPSVDQEEIALSPQENHLMSNPNIQMPELNSLTSKSVTSTPPSTHHQVQHQPQDAQEEALMLASSSAHPPQLSLSKLALESAFPDAHQLNLSSNDYLIHECSIIHIFYPNKHSEYTNKFTFLYFSRKFLIL